MRAVTWDPRVGSDDNTLVTVQVRYSDYTGFTTDLNITASTGYYVWNIDEDILSQDGRDGGDLTANISLVDIQPSADGSGSDVAYVGGPSVIISRSAPSYDASPENSFENHGRTIAIAVSVTVSAVLLVLAAFVIWSWKRHGHVFGFGGRKNRRDSQRTSGSKYGWPEDKNREVELTDRESWGPTPNKNVFRAEIQRQEMQRGY